MPPWAGVQRWERVAHGLDGGSRQCCALADVKVHQPFVVIAVTAASVISPQPMPAFHAAIHEFLQQQARYERAESVKAEHPLIFSLFRRGHPRPRAYKDWFVSLRLLLRTHEDPREPITCFKKRGRISESPRPFIEGLGGESVRSSTQSSRGATGTP
ncbi:hypothetical protein GW17_00029201 [Ensete ventricosum]|nr:hypothetical protein GW17_00029201 [Ensete ventricosum]